ncbi:chymotrypsin inhibitor SCI-III-like [Teleopsis dalmanni]|uniref:chymotrypsin inhibitor SCI-III-like n=1 Tax=Teleopsis dalmanni TaxID=139649 RepID=UPI0018CDF5E4|nr:chymotrypsin inhibitor SCI-III-like [Teleopsis dalmanni]
MNLKFFLSFMLFTLFLAISHAEVPSRCLEPTPKGRGLCEMLITGYRYNRDTKNCEEWSTSGCTLSKDKGHSYKTLDDCKKECENIV